MLIRKYPSLNSGTWGKDDLHELAPFHTTKLRSLGCMKLVFCPRYFLLNYLYSQEPRIGVKKYFHTGNIAEDSYGSS